MNPLVFIPPRHRITLRPTWLLPLLFLWLLAPVRPATGVGLDDFGYNHMLVNGKEARGHRPLLIILAQFEGRPLAHDVAYYDNFILNLFDPNSVNGFYLENSNGRFFWSRAGAGIIGPLDLPASAYRSNFFAVAGGQFAEELFVSNIVSHAMTDTSFPFADFDANADHIVTADELGILIISNDRESSGANRWTHHVKPDSSPVAVDLSLAEVSHQEKINLIAHEMSHSLGTWDIYGSEGLTMSQNLSLMANARSGDDIYHLDPWHKMQLGWAEPRIGSLREGGLLTLPAAQNTDPRGPVILYDPARFDAGGVNEFFILEYRTATGPAGGSYDRNVAGNGLVIWHIEQDAFKRPVKVTALEAGPYVGQSNWLWCRKCQGLFFGELPHPGPCPEDGGDHDAAGSFNYMMVGDVGGPSRQSQWKWCKKCQGLFYGPNQSASVCPKDHLNHDGSGSIPYSLVMNDPTSPGQHDWKWCRKCQGLFYGPNQDFSDCPQDGARHDGSFSSNYAMVRSLYSWGVFTLGAPDLLRGGNTVWTSGQTTPNLRWLDETDTPAKIYVHPFSAADGSITVEWLVDAMTWVDFAYFGLFEFGTADFPFNTLAEGVTAVPWGGTVLLRSGSTRETARITKHLKLQAFAGPVTIGR